MVLKETSVDSVAGIVNVQRDYFNSKATLPVAWRRTQLKALYKLVKENEDALTTAVAGDVGGSKHRAWLASIGMLYNDLSLALDNLENWIAPEFVSVVSCCCCCLFESDCSFCFFFVVIIIFSNSIPLFSDQIILFRKKFCLILYFFCFEIRYLYCFSNLFCLKKLTFSNFTNFRCFFLLFQPLVNKMDQCQIRHDPKGVVLIIGVSKVL
jgi:hypothetical protein